MPYRRVGQTLAAPVLPATSMPAQAMLEPVGPHQAQRALDTLVSSCRVLGTWGLQGSGMFSIPAAATPTYETDPRIYPDDSTARVVLRLYRIPLTPGHVVGLDVLALPSGPTQYSPETGQWDENGRGGHVTITVTYRNADADTATGSASVTPTGSDRVFGAEPALALGALESYAVTTTPFGLIASAANREKFARGIGVLVDVVVSYTGSVRIADFAVVERPSAMIVDTTSDEWPSNMYASSGTPYADLPSEYPVEQLTTSDPGGGLEAIRRALEQHGQQLGPCLAWQSSGREGADILTWLGYDDGTGDDEAPAINSSSTSYVVLPYGAALASTHFPGFQLGGYARQARDGDVFFDARTGVLPVWAVVYGRGDNATFKWQTGLTEWSAVTLPFASGSFGWVIRPGWVEVGTAPDDAPVARLLTKDNQIGGVIAGWRYAGLFFRPR
jgi:hypothetical protein